MLVTLNVKNFAIIDNIQVDFNKGLTVLTGETGAGKSLIIDAISLLFGERASSELIRHGEQKAVIEGLFSDYDKKIIEYLDEFGVEYDESDFLIIKREIYQNGKSLCKINNQLVSLSQLKQISEYIGDIHSQLETFGLINPKNYISFLRNSNIEEWLIEYNLNLKEYKESLKKLELLQLNIEENIKKEDFLKYQLNELSKAKLDVGEEDLLNNELRVLSNSEKMKTLVEGLKNIYNDENTLDKIYESINLLEKLSSYDTSFVKLKETVEEAYYNLEAVSTDKLLILNNYDFNESRFNEINDRLGLYSDLKRKYKKSTKDIIAFQNSLQEELDKITNYDTLKNDLENSVKEFYDKTLSIAKKIRSERMVIANCIVEKIKEHLIDLQLNNARFDITFNDLDENVVFQKDGIDCIDFLVSFNAGEPLKSLSKTASGGELSRFMLALKTVLGDKLPMQTKIFDEIDSGVSGSIAYSIGKKLQNISRTSQVLCITHLPQVASIADNHLKISKGIENDRTFTKVDILDIDFRINEIASMLSNGNITENSLKYAEELLKNK